MAVQEIPPFDSLPDSESRPNGSALQQGPVSPSQVTSAKPRPPRPRTLQRNAYTMHEPRLLQEHYPPSPFAATYSEELEAGNTPIDGQRAPIIIRPSGRPGFNAPKAATFFLGKDHERWRRYDRDRMGLGLAWGRIASAVSSRSEKRGSRGAHSSLSDTDDDLSDGGASVHSIRSFRSRSSRHSRGPKSRRPSEAVSPPLTPVDGIPLRARRFSSHGSEAAFLRHETVIGLHTPRRQSSSSSDAQPFLRPLAKIRPASGSPSSIAISPAKEEKPKADREKARRNEQEKHEERALRRAEKEREKELSKRKVKEKVHGTMDLGEAARPSLRRLRSNLEEAAAAAAASTQNSPILGAVDDELQLVDILRSTLSDAALDGKGPMSAIDLRSMVSGSEPSAAPFLRTASPRAPPLKLAKRKKPVLVEGTLYDKSGPHREGAVTDGLSVRLFSCEDRERQAAYEDADLSNPEKPVTKPWGRRGSSSSVDDEDGVFMRSSKRPQSAGGSTGSRRGSMNSGGSSPVQDIEEDGDAGYHASKPQVYLITTPDNRVSSAAKLRRWAMDGEGKFYAAMEIKSVEAKLRAADPSVGPATRELARELNETYLEDILDEVQKAETLNPTRTGAVAKLLKTEDGRYVRLEEDYPEEAFFVIAGCEEAELYPVLALIFTQALRTLSSFHAAGWMHGDVKLENLMFDETGQLVVIDYENANPYRGIPSGDGTVQLVSYDWIPPEASPGPFGRRMGPSGDLWALGCNLIRAFALRDGIEDLAIREALLGEGQKRFLNFIGTLVSPRKEPPQLAGQPASLYEIDMEPIFADAAEEPHFGPRDRDSSWGESPAASAMSLTQSTSQPSSDAEPSSASDALSVSTHSTLASAGTGCSSTPTSVPVSASASTDGGDALLPTPARLLYRFARSAPELLRFVLTRCVSDDIKVRGPDAEVEGLRLASWFENERADLLSIGRKAVDEAIEMSGSTWVRPRLDEARRSLGLD